MLIVLDLWEESLGVLSNWRNVRARKASDFRNYSILRTPQKHAFLPAYSMSFEGLQGERLRRLLMLAEPEKERRFEQNRIFEAISSTFTPQQRFHTGRVSNHIIDRDLSIRKGESAAKSAAKTARL